MRHASEILTVMKTLIARYSLNHLCVVTNLQVSNSYRTHSIYSNRWVVKSFLQKKAAENILCIVQKVHHCLDDE